MKRLLLILISIGAMLMAGCSFPTSRGTESGFLMYYLNQDLDQLETKAYVPSSADTEALIGEIIEQQRAAVPDQKLQRLLPDEVMIQGYRYEGGTLTLDFNDAYRTMVTGREVLCRGGLVREFLQIIGVERLAFTVAGEPLTDSYGSEIGMMTNESFVENSARTINAYQSVTMTLYFTDSTGTVLYPESRKAYYISSEPLEKAVVQEIMKGPRQTGHYATYGSGSRILSVITQDDVCYVNFDSSVLSAAVNVTEEVQIYSIVNALADTCGIKEVQFSVDGDSSSVFRENMSLGVPYTKNESLVRAG